MIKSQSSQQQVLTTQSQTYSLFQQWFIAAVNDNKNFIQEHKEFLKQTDQYGNTALMYAVKEGNNDLIPLLQDEIGCQNQQGFTALMFAISTQNNDAIDKLDKELHIVTSKRLSALHIAAAYNNVTATKQIYTKLSGLLSRTGQTSLMIACSLNNIDIVKILLPVEKQLINNSKMTPLMFAAQSGSDDVVRYLIINDNQELNKEDLMGQTALIKCFQQLEKTKLIESDINRTNMQYRLLQVIKLLLPFEDKKDQKTGTTILQYLAKFSANSLITDELIQKEAKMQNKQQMSALMYAAISNNTALIERLIEYEVGLQDVNGYTALIHSIINKNVEAASLLVVNESDLFDNKKNTPLMYAAKYGLEDLVQTLINSQFQLFNEDGEDALQFAVQGNNSEFIQYFGPLIDRRDKNNNSALHKAAEYNASECAQQLLQINQKLIQVKNNDNFTPIDIAANKNNSETLAVLLSYPHSQCNWLFSAIISDSWKVVKFAIDGARSGIISSTSNLNFQQQQECNVQLQQLTNKFQGYPDGFSCLLLAIYARSFNSAYLLYFVPQQPNKLNITPLMLLALQDCQEVPEKLLGMLIKRYAGQQLITEYAGLQAGMTALMIACSVNEMNNKLIELLAPIEADIVDQMGRKAIDYCNVGDKDEQIRNLLINTK